MRANNRPVASDLKSFRAFDEFKVRDFGSSYPEAKLHNSFECNADGSVGKYRTADGVHNAIGVGALKRDYSRIRVPILAFFGTLSVNPRYQPKDAEERAAMEEFDAATDVYEKSYKRSLQAAKGGVRIVDLPLADHYLFLSNRADVLRGIHAFLEGLRQSEFPIGFGRKS
jgi:pimeloyl-ACP methyl ester carboxylesterase